MKDITPEEAKQLLAQQGGGQTVPTQEEHISPEEAKQLLAQHSQGFPDVAQNVMTSMQPSPGLSSAQAMKAQSQGAIVGIMDLARGLANLVPRGTDMMGLKRPYEPFTQEQFGEKKVLSPELANTPEAQRGFLESQLLASAAVPMGEGGVLERAGKGFLTSEALSPIYQADEPIGKSLKGALGYSAAGSLAEPIMAGTKGIFSGLLKQGGTALPEEFERNVRAAELSGVKLPIGQAGVSPIVAGTQSILAKIPGVGAAQDFIKTGKTLKKETANTLDSLKTMPEVDGENNPPMKQISKSVRDKFLTLKKQDSANYKKVDEISKELGASVSDRSLTQEVGQRRLQEINDTLKVNPNRKIDPELLNDLTDASLGNAMPFSLSGPEKSRYRDLRDNAFESGDTYKGSIYSELLNAHSNDVANNIKNIDDPRLANALEEANKFHATKIAPIKNDPNLYKYAQGIGDHDLLAQTFVKGGQYDRPEKANAIYSLLSPDEQKQLTHEILTRSQRVGFEGEPVIREDKALNQFNDIGDRTKDIMFKHAPEQRDKMAALYHTRKLFDSNLDQMSNPKTGEQGAKQFWLKMGALAALGSVGGYEYKKDGDPTTLALGLLGVPLALGYSKFNQSDLAKSLFRAGSKISEKPNTKIPANIGLLLQAGEGNDQ